MWSGAYMYFFPQVVNPSPPKSKNWQTHKSHKSRLTLAGASSQLLLVWISDQKLAITQRRVPFTASAGSDTGFVV